ncbi:MAG: hypothetical protein EAZ47_11475 [Bacteroidetes bacterium]|nr:MAG: hypothetical protein EAZ47_11475 [Bacteroidota bacterium]
MKYELVQIIIGKLSEFEAQQPRQEANSLTDFAKFILATEASENKATTLNESRGRPDNAETLDSMLSKLLVFLYRHAKLRIRQGMQGNLLQGFDDFAFLVTLYGLGPMSKMEIIEKNVQEKNTGIQIIKRLIAKNLMEESEHPTDKRSKLLTLTETGKTVLLQSFAPMSHITETISGNLTETEKLQLLQLLQKLHTYHLPWYLGMER